MSTNRALILRPGDLRTSVVEVENSLEALQAVVGGLLAPIRLERAFRGTQGCTALVDEEAAMRGIPVTSRLFDKDGHAWFLRGPVVVIGDTVDGDWVSLHDLQVARWRRALVPVQGVSL
jgi:hypothetical protein